MLQVFRRATAKCAGQCNHVMSNWYVTVSFMSMWYVTVVNHIEYFPAKCSEDIEPPSFCHFLSVAATSDHSCGRKFCRCKQPKTSECGGGWCIWRSVITTQCPKISGTPVSNTPNSVCSSWISTKYRTLHCLSVTYCQTHYDVCTLPCVLSVLSLWRHSLFTLRYVQCIVIDKGSSVPALD